MFLQTLIGFFLTCASLTGTTPADAPAQEAVIERTLSIVKPDALDQADEIQQRGGGESEVRQSYCGRDVFNHVPIISGSLGRGGTRPYQI